MKKQHIGKENRLSKVYPQVQSSFFFFLCFKKKKERKRRMDDTLLLFCFLLDRIFSHFVVTVVLDMRI